MICGFAGRGAATLRFSEFSTFGLKIGIDLRSAWSRNCFWLTFVSTMQSATILDLVKEPEFHLGLDPVDSDDNYPSVAFNIGASFSMPFQHSTITIKECWISHDALNKFEEELTVLRDCLTGRATLQDMNDVSVVIVERNADKITTRVQASDTVNMGKVVLEVYGYSSEINSMLRRIRDYPKWW